MGLFMRLNVFRGVSHDDVYAALTDFWSRQDRQVERVAPDARADAFDLYEQRDGWTLLDWTSGWEWTLRRQAQFHVSEVLGCAGALVFVYDGDYWGYELFERGVAVDWFGQSPEGDWFPGKDSRGRPEAVVAAFPELALDRADVAAYLAQSPGDEDDEERWDAKERWDVPARPGDRFARGDESAVLDFLELLGVGAGVVETRVRWRAPLSRRFMVVPPPVD
ncbi:hypothetical protein HH310_21305 [Actinoplanes sp. TBRC 11911]|uniref:hypothetical protein n=1 Tax=Actinoplanes sp. TBRC 11911 TaxID=2729386 RepID=UPI00145EDD27|nr:hypothetical protein [Actinoplanes sp. TBRC 11911]NMO53710.1 hypothetical protein [Actinoplanes sp. TBRC 11911]